MTVLVDSDVLIEVSRGKNAGIVSKWNALNSSIAAILFSSVSVAEVWGGVRTGEADALDKLFRLLVCIPIDSDIGRRAGGFMQQYRKSHGVEIADAMIAASAERGR